MNGLALGLVLGAAGMHATWNYLAKRVGGGAAFVWLNGALAALLYAPLAAALLLFSGARLSGTAWAFVAGSGVLHTAYFLSLQRGYRTGDLSLVYPLARGSGPLLATAAAIGLLGERPSALALAGALLIAGGVFLLAGSISRAGDDGEGDGESEGADLRAAHAARRRAARTAGLVTGAIIATYTLWDKQAVSALLVPPLVLDWGANVGRAVWLAPLAWRRREEVRAVWRQHGRATLAVAVLTPLAYILVLTAMRFTPVSYIAPAREISILVGAVLGARLLKEGDTGRRLLAATVMVAGLAALALG